MTTPKVHRPEGPDGGDELVVESGGKITVKSGGTVAVETGGTFDMDEGTVVVTEPDDVSLEVDSVTDKLQIKSQEAIADLGLTASSTYTDSELTAVAAKVDALLAALRLAKIIGSGD